MSTRGDILIALETALHTISVDEGYSVDIGLVTRGGFSQNEIDRSNSPAISIVDDGIERPEGNIAGNWRVTATLTLEGFVRHNNNSPSPSDLSTLYNDFIADVRKCLHAIDLGANVMYARPGDLKSMTGEAMIIFSYIVEILYYYSETAP